EATGATDEFKSMVYAFPNPVRPEYDGPIVITGLANDSNVKITDTTGKLVFETTSLGGQAVWYGKDYNGRKANSGVYLVFATSLANIEDPSAYVTKILLVN
ncbi:MAG TPA: T9SS type A sorting domain-containing protein, partial [Saprospiraceae bacterium]|nr:T9SS type A sorting domain-containing protein [Saprospiraceae bacterium]